MSRSKQETLLLEERIEKIRKKNEEIKRRHLEVEADKQNAAKLNALVQINSSSEDWPIGGKSPPHNQGASRSNTIVQNNTSSENWHCEGRLPPNNQGISRPRRSDITRSKQYNSVSGGQGKCYVFGEGDGPPPDPKYKFLADSERDIDKTFSERRPRTNRGRGGGRGAFTRDRQNRGSSHQFHRDSEPLHPEYEAWRAERNRIDNDRINRQKTTEGHWRREWDNEKITQDDDEKPISRTPRGGSRRSNNWNSGYDFNQHRTHDYNSPKENLDSGGSLRSERSGRGSATPRISSLRGQKTLRQKSLTADVLETEESTPSPIERSVISVGESIKVSVPNDSSISTVKRVKVNAPIVGGTGRVGPRQKIQISYSSQSEDEAPHSQTIEIQSRRTATSINVPSNTNNSNQSILSPSSKPPLPPFITQRVEPPKPRRLRPKRIELDFRQRKRVERKESDSTEEDKVGEDNDSGKLVDETQKENESGGDDSWEDVTTTSGNESACEEMSPCGASREVLHSICDKSDTATPYDKELNALNLNKMEENYNLISNTTLDNDKNESEILNEKALHSSLQSDITESNKSNISDSNSPYSESLAKDSTTHDLVDNDCVKNEEIKEITLEANPEKPEDTAKIENEITEETVDKASCEPENCGSGSAVLTDVSVHKQE